MTLNPVAVQGATAASEIAEAIRDFNRYGKIDVMIVGRGGGSMEDLWAFNEVAVARAIHASKIPVVSAVGHEIDFTIADFAADLRAPTPSAAAELVVKDRFALLDIVHNYWYTMHQDLLAMLSNRKENIRHLLRSYSFNKPFDLLRQFSQRVDELDRGVSASISHRLTILKAMSQSLRHRVLALDPEQVLHRGYAIVYKDNKIVSSSKQLRAPDNVDIKFHDGTVPSKVL
ncbi:MAG: exodeoxyribonuclease VII large subunit [Ignavibacteriae bacterium]|nr:exodeoxyribonuclease VII large subunit [Ignavibacteriota bacterium]